MSVLMVLFVWLTHVIVPLMMAFFSLFQGWKPPFSVNVETFRFTPRLQPLNELEVMCEIHKEVKKHMGKFSYQFVYHLVLTSVAC